MLEWFEAMTKYELMTIILSLVVFIKPLLVYIYKRVTSKLIYYPNGEIKLFFNKSGSYVQIYGSCKAVNSDIVVNKIEAVVSNKKDDRKLKMVWSSFIAPFVQQMGDDFVRGNEQVHPFQICENVMVPTFVEFEVMNRTSSKEIDLYMQNVEEYVSKLDYDIDFASAWELYQQEASCIDIRKCLEKEFYWDTGSYTVNMRIYYNSNSNTEYEMDFDVTEEKALKLKMNIDEVIRIPFSKRFNRKMFFYTHDVLK